MLIKLYRFFRKQFNYKKIKIINWWKCFKSKKKLKKYKNLHLGQRCFIVGNGPSLTVEDLEKLKNEITFGTHQIYNIFNFTNWRPTYYCAQDCELIQKSIEEISNLNVKDKFIALIKNRHYNKINDATYVNISLENFFPNPPQFSNNIINGIYEGFTVSYMCIQIAIYMGFKEIYLLGIDHNYKITLSSDGNIVTNDNVKNHFSDNYALTNIPQLHKSTLAYIAAKNYAENYNIKILNATRGGNLEVFNRIDFDDLF